MSSTTIARGNVLSSTVIQYTLASKTIADTSDEVSITVPDVAGVYYLKIVKAENLPLPSSPV